MSEDRMIKDLVAASVVTTGDFVPVQSASGVEAIKATVGQIVSAGFPKGAANQILAMNQTGTAPVWVNGNPPFTAANAGQFLGVKPDGTAMEWRNTYSEDTMEGWPSVGAVVVNSRPIGTLLGWESKPSITSLTINGLTILLGLGSNTIDLHQWTSLESISIPHLTTSYGTIRIRASNTALKTISMPRLNLVKGAINISNLPELTAFETASGIEMSSIYVANCPKLSTVPQNIFANVIDFSGCAIPQTAVDSVLRYLKQEFDGKNNALSMWRGILNLSGGTNAAPSANGIIDAQTLIARGATITLNGTAITTTKRTTAFGIPDYDTVSDKGKTLAVKADGTGLEWRA